jgi:hypothetical protein
MHPLYFGSGCGRGGCVCVRLHVRACVLLICSKNKLDMHFGCVMFKIVVFGIQRHVLDRAVYCGVWHSASRIRRGSLLSVCVIQ